MEKLISFLSQAISEFKQADLFESANDTYKLLLPIYERQNLYETLSNCHLDLHQLFTNILECVRDFFIFFALWTSFET